MFSVGPKNSRESINRPSSRTMADFAASSSSSSSSSSSVPMDTDEPTQTKRNVPWVEKYRPEKVDDVSHQEEIVKTLKTSIEQGNIPHLMFYGPPGTGKTTTVLAVARALFGPHLYKSRILDLNASDERGISVVRDKIKTFAQRAVSTEKTPGYPCPRFKLIILDEADTMTSEAQSALRRIMEAYSKVTRFCLICNYVTRIIEPLASRCAKFRFKSLSMDSMTNRLNFIAQSEGVKLAEGAMETLMTASGGDMRKAVTFLQSSHQLVGGGDEAITSSIILDLTSTVPDSAIDELWTAMNSGVFDVLAKCTKNMILSGFPMSAILPRLHDDVVVHKTLKDVDKALICEKLAQVENNLIDGSSEALQLQDTCAFIQRRLGGWNLEIDSVKFTSAH